MINKIIISLIIFTVSIKPVNADPKKFDEFSQKFNQLLKCFKNEFKDEIIETKDFQKKQWAEVKSKTDKNYKIVKNKLSGFFSDFPDQGK